MLPEASPENHAIVWGRCAGGWCLTALTALTALTGLTGLMGLTQLSLGQLGQSTLQHVFH